MFFDRHLPVRLPRPPRPCRGASRGPRPARKSIQPENLFFVYPLCFDILPNSFALTKFSTLLFSCDSKLFSKNTRVGGTSCFGSALKCHACPKPCRSQVPHGRGRCDTRNDSFCDGGREGAASFGYAQDKCCAPARTHRLNLRGR